MTRGQSVFEALSLEGAHAIPGLVRGAPWNGRIKLSRCCDGEHGQLIFFTERGRVTVTIGIVCYRHQKRIWPDRPPTKEDLIAASLHGQAHHNWHCWPSSLTGEPLATGRQR
jgi:hypothetical protein